MNIGHRVSRLTEDDHSIAIRKCDCGEKAIWAYETWDTAYGVDIWFSCDDCWPRDRYGDPQNHCQDCKNWVVFTKKAEVEKNTRKVEMKRIYREVFDDVPEDAKFEFFTSSNDDMVVGALVDSPDGERFLPFAWLRFYGNSEIEKGILWGGDVWEPGEKVNYAND